MSLAIRRAQFSSQNTESGRDRKGFPAFSSKNGLDTLPGYYSLKVSSKRTKEMKGIIVFFVGMVSVHMTQLNLDDTCNFA